MNDYETRAKRLIKDAILALDLEVIKEIKQDYIDGMDLGEYLVDIICADFNINEPYINVSYSEDIHTLNENGDNCETEYYDVRYYLSDLLEDKNYIPYAVDILKTRFMEVE